MAGSGFAQSVGSEAPKDKYYCVKAGANFTNFSVDTEGLSTQTAFHIGLYALYIESRHVGIQPEIQYSMQGANFENGHLCMHYAVVPVMLKVFPVPTFSLQAGPYAAFLLSDKVKTDSYPAQYKGNGQDFGFAYGLSFGHEDKLTISARHQVGLFNLSMEEGKIRKSGVPDFVWCVHWSKRLIRALIHFFGHAISSPNA